MKKESLIITITILAIVLSGCQTNTATIPDTTSQNTTSPTEAPQQKPLSKFDTTAFSGAITLKDEKNCEKISNEEYKQQCIDEIKTIKIQDEASLRMDPKICEQMEKKEDIETCKLTIEIDKEYAEQMRAPNDDEMAIFEKAQNTLDKSLCEQLGPKDYRESCILVIEDLEKNAG